jgi:hypothetical protein
MSLPVFSGITPKQYKENLLSTMKRFQHRLNLCSLNNLRQDGGRLENREGVTLVTGTSAESLSCIAEAVNALHMLIGEYQDLLEEYTELGDKLERYREFIGELDYSGRLAAEAERQCN